MRPAHDDGGGPPIPALVFDANRVTAFLRSVARARAAQNSVRLEWVPYRESGILNVIYKVLFRKGDPGVAEVRQHAPPAWRPRTKGGSMLCRSQAVRGSGRALTLALAMLVCGGRAGVAEPAQRVTLFTMAEAQHLRLSDADWKQPRRTRGAAPATGPRIEVKTPRLRNDSDGPVLETKTPANLAISFEANRAPVNMRSLEVTARKGIFSKSLTDLLKPYVRGTSLAVDGVAIPGGRFLIEIAIADEGGAQTVETFRLQVDE